MSTQTVVDLRAGANGACVWLALAGPLWRDLGHTVPRGASRCDRRSGWVPGGIVRRN